MQKSRIFSSLLFIFIIYIYIIYIYTYFYRISNVDAIDRSSIDRSNRKNNY